MKRANLIAWAGLAVAIGVLVLSVVLLVRGRAGAQKAKMDRDTTRLELQRLFAQNPFPTPENVAQSRENLDQLRTWHQRLVADLREGEIAPTLASPSVFVERLTEITLSLRADAPRRAGAPVVAPSFLFGFDRYLGPDSVMPQPEHVPRLMRQLLKAEKLMRGLYATETLRVTQLQRDGFEDARGDGRGRPDTTPTRRTDRRAARRPEPSPTDFDPPPEPHRQQTETFDLRLQARSNALFDIMNNIARMRPFAVIEELEIEKTAADVHAPTDPTVPRNGSRMAQPAGMPATDAPPRDPELREARMVAGPDRDPPLNIRLRVVFHMFEGD